MSLSRLQIFQRAARLQSFAAAGEALGLTGSAVSQHMAQLEAEVGAELFVRTARGTELTEAGRALLRRSNALLAEVRNVHAELQAMHREEPAPLRLGCPSERLAVELAGALAAELGDLEVQLTVDGSGALVDLVADGLLDVAVAFEPDRPRPRDPGPAPAWSEVRAEALADDPFVALLPAAHPAAGRPFAVGRLAGWPVVGSRDDHGMSLVLEACRQAGVAPAFLEHECEDYDSMLALVRIEDGVALVPRLATLGRPDDLAVAPLGWPPPRRRLMAVSQLREPAPEHARARAVIAAALAP